MDADEVQINPERVKAVADLLASLELAEIVPATWSDPLMWNTEANRQDRCQLLAIGNAINFRFWRSDGGDIIPSVGLVNGVRYRGAFYMWRRLRVALQRGEISLNASWLARLDVETFKRAFTDDEGRNPLEPAIEDRVANLNQLGVELEANWGGQFSNLIDESSGSLSRFVELSSRLRAYDDPLRKLTMLNVIMLTGTGLAVFDEEPTVAVDYHLVKQAVRQGLVTMNRNLESKLRSGDFLTAVDSYHLRSSVPDAMDLLQSLTRIPGSVLDNFYWFNRSICSEVDPDCQNCPFVTACLQDTELRQPRELTRYY
jgi:hypothetical protein